MSWGLIAAWGGSWGSWGSWGSPAGVEFHPPRWVQPPGGGKNGSRHRTGCLHSFNGVNKGPRDGEVALHRSAAPYPPHAFIYIGVLRFPGPGGGMVAVCRF